MLATQPYIFFFYFLMAHQIHYRLFFSQMDAQKSDYDIYLEKIYHAVLGRKQNVSKKLVNKFTHLCSKEQTIHRSKVLYK